MSETDDRAAVVIERTFAAPVEQIWQMWTVPEHFASWYGPTGATITVAQMDVRVSGARLVGMEMMTPNVPMAMWFAGEFLEVVEPGRLVYTEVLADEHGHPLDAADDPGGNAVTEVRVELFAVDGGTRMVMTHVGVPAGSPGEAGWMMAIDKLDQVLAS